MEAYLSLRQWFYRLRRKRLRKEKKPVPILPGIPEDLDRSRLEKILEEHFGQKLDSVTYGHLSGWKSSGAYRLHVQTKAGKEISIIYKNAVYDRDEIPALVDFPLIPGPPEYAILSQSRSMLADFLPRVYSAEEIEPGKQYRYLLEDLQQNYRPIKGDADKHLVIPQIVQLHRALAEWQQQSNAGQLLQYGPVFSAALQDYARSRLEQYQLQTDHKILRMVLSEWEHIARLHLDPVFFSQPMRLIHGDSNYTNIHLGKQNSQHMKVVDWEWAGFSSPYADLASLVKGSLLGFEKRAFREFCEVRGEGLSGEQSMLDAEAHWRNYQWSMLERSMIDAAFLSAQYLGAPNKARVHLPDAIAGSLRRLYSAYRRLES